MITSTRAAELLASLSLEQRVGQLNQRLLGWQAVERVSGSWQITDEGKAEIERWSGLGAIYGLMRADAWSGRSWQNGVTPDDRLEVVELLQSAVRQANPCGISALVVEEAPHGHQALGGTILPQNLAIGATWDPDLVAGASAAVATELAASGIDIALVSGLDMLRDPRWGRGEECFGEDPYLSSQLVAAIVHGMQGQQRERLGRDGVGVVLKHMAGQGEAVGGRNGQSAVIGHRDLTEVHLPAVRAGIDAGAVGLMAAYNDIDGVPCSANPWLLRTWLRSECGFEGIVMADGLAVDQLLPLAGSIEAAGRLALLSGIDVSLWDDGFTTLVGSAEQSEVVRKAVDGACLRVLTLKEQLGLLPDHDAPKGHAPRQRIELRPDLDAALQVSAGWSRRLADAALVLLDGSLPELGSGKVAVIGPYAQDTDCFLGDYVAPLPEGFTPNVSSELAELLPGQVQVISSEAVDFDAQIAAASTVIAVVGGTSRRSYADEFDLNGAALGTAASSGEGVDLADVTMPAAQIALLQRARALATGKLVSVVVAGRPHVLTEVLAASDATLWAGYAGPYGPAAVATALATNSTPAGRLPVTLLRHSGAGPVRHNDRWVATYHDVPDPVLLPFAQGEGVGRVEADPLALEADEVALRITVFASDQRGGDRVLPVFVSRYGGVVLPRKQELLAFERIRVPIGGSQQVEFRWSAKELTAGVTSVDLRLDDQLLGSLSRHGEEIRLQSNT